MTLITRHAVALLALALAGGPPAGAAPSAPARAAFAVTTAADSGPGSLRQALLDANATPGADLITFAITGGSAPYVIPVATALPALDEAVVLDGTTQPGWAAGAPAVVLDGGATAPDTPGLVLQAAASVVRGVAVSGFRGDGVVIRGADAALEGSWVGLPAGNAGSGVRVDGAARARIGGPGAARNTISGNGAYGVFVSAAAGVVVENNFVGTNAAGSAALPNGADGVLLQQSTGGTVASNVVSGNRGSGVYLDTGSTGNVVRGNFVGTDTTGVALLGNALDGVVIDGAADNLVGGAGAGNVVSNNGGPGVTISGAGATGNVIAGNKIGTGPAGGEPRGNAFEGVYVSDASNNTVGGTTPGAGNVIAYSGAAGVYVDLGSGNQVLGNSIFANTGLGIDLDPVGVTPNDSDDSDAGANGLQNSPVFTVTGTAVQGAVRGAANAAYRVELFINPACDPAGAGEGAAFAGAASLATDASGAGAFAATLPRPLAAGEVVTATATGPSGTSEFSACVSAGGPPPADSADVSLGLMADAGEVVTGGAVTLTMTVGNAGPRDAAAVVLATSTPAGTVFRSAASSAGSCETPAAGGTGAITCALGTLAPSATATVTVVLDVTAGAGEEIAAGASVASPTPDATAANNAAAVTVTVVAPPVDPPVVASVQALAGGKPFRLKLTGSNLQPGVQVFVGADETPWGNVSVKNGTAITLKGGKPLKAKFPKGVAVPIRVLNPDGGETVAPFTR